MNIFYGPSPTSTGCWFQGNSTGGGGGAICLENTFKNSATNVLGFCALCQTKDQSLPVLMGHKKNFIFFFKFNKLQII